MSSTTDERDSLIFTRARIKRKKEKVPVLFWKFDSQYRYVSRGHFQSDFDGFFLNWARENKEFSNYEKWTSSIPPWVSYKKKTKKKKNGQFRIEPFLVLFDSSIIRCLNVTCPISSTRSHAHKRCILSPPPPLFLSARLPCRVNPLVYDMLSLILWMTAGQDPVLLVVDVD